MPVGSSDALKAIELLELYRSKLSETSDKNLIEAIDKVINVFNSQFFIALLATQMLQRQVNPLPVIGSSWNLADRFVVENNAFFQNFRLIEEIQRFYIDILSNNYLSISDKTQETLNFLNSLKLYPSSPSSVSSSGRVGSRLANDVESINMLYSSLRRKESLTNSNISSHKKYSNTYSQPSMSNSNESSSRETNNSFNEIIDQDIDNQLINRPIVMEAVILKGSTGFGFSVAGGIDNPYFHLNDPGIYVTKITPGGSVDLSGSLNIDDQILSVNGINMTYLTHEAAVSALKEAGDELHLVIQRDPTLKHRMSGLGYMRRKNASLTASTISDSRQDSQAEKSSSQVSPEYIKTNSHSSVWVTSSKASSVPSNLSQGIKSSNSSFVSLKSRIVTISLIKGERGLGFSIGGGRGNEHYVGDPGIYITKVMDKGAAATCGLISEGDKLVQVNDYLLTDVTHEEAVKILCNVGSKVELKILKPNSGVSNNVTEQFEEPFSNCQSSKDLSESLSNNDSPVRLNGSDNNHDIFFDEVDSNFINKSPRIVVLSRPNETVGFGFNIVGGEDEDGIFVSFIIPSGIADKNGNIFVGDRIWQVNGTDISIATHDEAASLLKGSGKTLELLLTTDMNEYVAFESKFNWNTHKNKDNNWSTSKSTPNLAETINNKNYYEMMPKNDIQHRSNNDHMRSVGCEINHDPISIDRQQIEPYQSSPMYKSSKSIDVFNNDGKLSRSSKRTKTPASCDYDSRISEKENHQIFTFESNTSTTNSATNHSGISNGSGNLTSDKDSVTRKNGFYVRALFEFDPDVEKNLPSRPLAFLTNDIILIVNSADPDWWQARVVEDNNENGPLGIIPSPNRLYRKEKRNKKKVNFDSQLVSKNSKKNSLPRNGKPSFIKRMQLGSMSKSAQNITEDKSYADEYMNEKFTEANLMLLYYEPLVKISLDYVRPVVIIGPLRDKINDTLIDEHPNLFASCVPHTTRSKKPFEVHGKDYYFVKDRSEMEEQIKHQEFIEAGQYKDNLYGTSIAAVRDVAKLKHCVLDVNALAIKRLVAANLLPITILIKPPSVKALCNLSSKITVAQADREVKKAEELQSKISHYFTAVVWEDSFNGLYSQIKSIVQCNSGSDIWVPTNQNTVNL